MARRSPPGAGGRRGGAAPDRTVRGRPLAGTGVADGSRAGSRPPPRPGPRTHHPDRRPAAAGGVPPPVDAGTPPHRPPRRGAGRLPPAAPHPGQRTRGRARCADAGGAPGGPDRYGIIRGRPRSADHRRCTGPGRQGRGGRVDRLRTHRWRQTERPHHTEATPRGRTRLHRTRGPGGVPVRRPGQRPGRRGPGGRRLPRTARLRRQRRRRHRQDHPGRPRRPPAGPRVPGRSAPGRPARRRGNAGRSG